MFQGHLTIRGGTAAVLWGYRTAAAIRTWTIAKHENVWTLSATLERADAFGLRQRGLLFSAPRAGGYWCWSVLDVTVVNNQLRARLGPPEQ